MNRLDVGELRQIAIPCSTLLVVPATESAAVVIVQFRGVEFRGGATDQPFNGSDPSGVVALGDQQREIGVVPGNFGPQRPQRVGGEFRYPAWGIGREMP
jgi:hypothetical protein